jgi:hypothetical protein
VGASTEELKQRIAELRARLPRHSLPPAMLLELEELEERLERSSGEESSPSGG